MFIHAFLFGFQTAALVQSWDLNPDPKQYPKEGNLQYVGRKNHQVWFLS